MLRVTYQADSSDLLPLGGQRSTSFLEGAGPPRRASWRNPSSQGRTRALRLLVADRWDRHQWGRPHLSLSELKVRLMRSQFQCAQRDSLSELFLEEKAKVPCIPGKGISLADSEKLWEASLPPRRISIKRNTCHNQCKGTSPRDSEKLREVLLCACAD